MFSLKMSDAVCNNEKSNIAKPYKTCRLRRLLEPFLSSGPESIKKALGFHSKLNAFCAFPKHQKPLVKQRFEAS